jgi:hypothetical protein
MSSVKVADPILQVAGTHPPVHDDALRPTPYVTKNVTIALLSR